MADKTIGGEGQIDAEELERYLCRWCYNNGTPFTTITYSVNGGLSIKEDNGARRLYEQAFPYHDEPLLDAEGNIVGIQTVANTPNSQLWVCQKKKPKNCCIRMSANLKRSQASIMGMIMYVRSLSIGTRTMSEWISVKDKLPEQ